MADGPSRSLLNPHAAAQAFTLSRRDPAPDLAPLVLHCWMVRWDLRQRPPFRQETLPYPCVDLVFGTHQPGLHGVLRRRFVADLRGEGWVLGVKFRAGAFRAVLGRDVSTITDRALDAGDASAFGPAGATLAAAVGLAADDAARIALVEAFLRAHSAPLSPEGALVVSTVAQAEGDPSLARVAELARRVDATPRTLERLFRAHAGVSPKWVLRTFRVLQAAERVKAGAPADWAGLAQELGYFDQPHFIRDFKAWVGETPASYARRCEAALAPGRSGGLEARRRSRSRGPPSAGAAG